MPGEASSRNPVSTGKPWSLELAPCTIYPLVGLWREGCFKGHSSGSENVPDWRRGCIDGCAQGQVHEQVSCTARSLISTRFQLNRETKYTSNVFKVGRLCPLP